ncbi:MAG: homoserine dehydrogenase [Thermoplasmata archaeon]
MVVGFGVVGRSSVRALCERREELRRKFGLNPKVIAIIDINGALVDSKGISQDILLKASEKGAKIEDFKDIFNPDAKLSDLLSDLDCEVMVETTPTNLSTGQPGLDHMKLAMKNGLHVVTTNKGPLALAMPALLELAEHNRVQLKFSGTVGGGTPMLDLAKKCMDGIRIESFMGILNGTTNYILSKMDFEGLSFQAALEEARSRGYAEADPSYDVDALDPAAKLVIMANWVMGKKLSIRDLKIIGIRDVRPEDIQRAKSEGKIIKLIASCGERQEVVPMAIPRDHPLNVGGTLNALTFRTDLAGEITIIGKGAGGLETASAVLRDLIDIRKSYTRQALAQAQKHGRT